MPNLHGGKFLITLSLRGSLTTNIPRYTDSPRERYNGLHEVESHPEDQRQYYQKSMNEGGVQTREDLQGMLMVLL